MCSDSVTREAWLELKAVRDASACYRHLASLLGRAAAQATQSPLRVYSRSTSLDRMVFVRVFTLVSGTGLL